MCGNAVCESGETPTSCASDCAATLVVQNGSALTIGSLYVYPCGTAAEGPNQLRASLAAGTRITFTAVPPGCYRFHAVATTGTYWRSSADADLIARRTFTWTLTN